jgi:putative peptide zinc metalloprotease protein
VVRSPQDGILIAELPMKQLLGQYLRRGQVPAAVMHLDDLRVTALIDQPHNASPFFDAIQHVELRTAGNIERVLVSEPLNFLPAGSTQLPHRSLGYPGGGRIATDHRDPHGETPLRPQFEVWLSLPKEILGHADTQGSVAAPLPGQRVHVRFTLPKRPLIAQWIHRLRQLFRDLGI